MSGESVLFTTEREKPAIKNPVRFYWPFLLPPTCPCALSWPGYEYVIERAGNITISFFAPLQIKAQCSICAKTTLQMGEKPAKGFNSGIIYLMLAPFAIAGYVGYRWWKGKDV